MINKEFINKVRLMQLVDLVEKTVHTVILCLVFRLTSLQVSEMNSWEGKLCMDKSKDRDSWRTTGTQGDKP